METTGQMLSLNCCWYLNSTKRCDIISWSHRWCLTGVLHREQLSVCVEQLIYQHHHIIKPTFRQTDFLLDKYPCCSIENNCEAQTVFVDESLWRGSLAMRGRRVHGDFIQSYTREKLDAATQRGNEQVRRSGWRRGFWSAVWASLS